MLGEHGLRGLIDAAPIRRVDPDRVDAGMLRGDRDEPVLSASAHDDGVAAFVQAQSESEADAAGRAGNEDGVSADVHGFSIRATASSLQRPVIQGRALPGSDHAAGRYFGGGP